MFNTVEQDEMEKMAEEVRERIEAAGVDPTTQQYYRREDKKTVVKTDTEYSWCQQNQVPLTVISYSAAVHCLKLEEARTRAEKKAKMKVKAARKARRKNR